MERYSDEIHEDKITIERGYTIAIRVGVVVAVLILLVVTLPAHFIAP